MILVTDVVCGLCVKHIPVSQFQWFIYIVSYLQFVTVKTVLTAKS